MKPSDVEKLLGLLGCDRIRVRTNGWVVGTCPFAPWTHAGGVDSSPSFGVIATEGPGAYKCLACKRHGLLATLPFALQALGFPKAREVADFLRHRTLPDLKETMQKVRKARYIPPRSLRPVRTLEEADLRPGRPERDLEHFLPLPGVVLDGNVLGKRTITPATYEAWEVRWHPRTHRVALPIRDHRHRLVGIAGRLDDDLHCALCGTPYTLVYLDEARKKKRVRCLPCDRDRPAKYLHSTGFSRDFYLYGEHLVAKGAPVILVEGQFDTQALWQWGYNALGIMGSYLSEVQVAKIRAWFPDVTGLPDPDKAGDELGASILTLLGPHLPTRLKHLPNGADSDEASASTLCDILGPPPFKRS